MSKQAKPYSYFDTPNGEDVGKKLAHVLKPTILTAFAIGTADVLLVSHPKGYLQTLGRYAYVGLPIIAVSTVFVTAVNIAASLRKKDDKLNWFFSGFAAGTVFGISQKRTMIGFNMGMALGIAALTKKYFLEEGLHFSPEKAPIANGGVWVAQQDYTLTAHRPGNWTTGK